MHQAPSLRRLPQQERSRARVQRILDAAARVLADSGWEALNTNAIAARAGVPVGSVYQFFPNKEAVVRALAERSLDRLGALVDELASGSGTAGWEGLMDRFLDALAAFWRSEPGLRAAWLGGQISPDLAALEASVDREAASRVARLLERVRPPLKEEVRRRAAAVLVQVAGPLLSLAARAGPREGAAYLAEAKRLMKAYVKSHAGGAR
jgi:AcrR family transcriptional regulator